MLLPTLFSLYTEPTVRMRKMNARGNVGNNKVCVLLYANDVIIMGASADLQILIDAISGFGTNSKIMIVNRLKG